MTGALSRHRTADGAERRLLALRASGLLGAPAEERFDRLTRLACHLLRVPVALVSLLDAERQFFLSAQGLAEPWAGRRQTPLAYSFCRWVVEAGLPLAVADVREDPRLGDNPAIEELGIAAYIAMPLALPDGCIIGALCGIDHRPRAWTAAEQAALRDLAGAVEAEMAAGLRQHEAETAGAALRASEARYRALFEVSPQMVWFTDAQGRCSYVNQYYIDFTGLPAEQAMGEGWLAAVHAADRASVRAAWAGAVASESGYEIEYRIRRGSDGIHRWFFVRGTPQRDPDGRVRRWIGVGIDIDDRRRAEDRLHRHSRRLELLSAAAAGLLAVRDPDEVLQPLFRSLAAEFGIDVSFSFVLDETGEGLRLASCFGVPEEARTGLARLAFGQAVCGTVAQTRRAMYLTDVQASGDPKLRLIKGHGIRAYACFPLLSAGDRLLGTLSFGTRGRDRLSEGDLAFLGTIAKYVAVVRERQSAEAALRVSESRLHLALAAGRLAFWEVDLDTGAVLRGPSHDAIFGYRATLPAWSYGAFLAHVLPEDRGAVERAYRAALNGESEATVECRIRRAGDDAVRWLEVHGRAHRDAEGRAVRLHGVLRDITERKETEAALRASGARLRELQAELLHVSRLSAAGEMATALAHELHQPLTAATTALQAARRMLAASAPQGPGAMTEVREAMDLAAGQGLRAGQIVRRLRDFVAHGETEKRPEHLPRLVEEASALAMVGARERGIALALRLGPRLPPVQVDRVQIQQVLFNLIRNAFEAMVSEVPARGRPATRYRELVVKAALAGPETVEVAVADSGPGLAPEVAGRLFEPFVSTKPDGMGVGLSISRTIIEAHGGRLWVEANPGGGAVFRFTLPAAPPDAEAR
ncbi:PAS domain S-box protein [Roseicella aerolata]|uniref:histidine kinase n=1 Tax=Roseicella aerolata TaxID=2883479 RepID=A0A9X1IC43_9PROT|nr:PAS domain S-box protein [Roseicella aerolata]MCB4822019.1 PAS domain S-box protein [Roseicella aerolata]